MISFKLFYPVYLRYFLTNLFFTMPCYYLFQIVRALYNFNAQIFSIIWNTLTIICVILCYKLILKEILFGKYQKIVVKTKFTSISWKFTIYSFIISIIVLILYGIILNISINFIPMWIIYIICITIDYFIMNFWLKWYAKLEISIK